MVLEMNATKTYLLYLRIRMKGVMEKLTFELLGRILLFSVAWGFVGTVIVVAVSFMLLPFFEKIALRRHEKAKIKENS